MDRLADYQEAHIDEVVNVAPVMEMIDIAKDMLGTGESADALDFARKASEEAERIMAPKAPQEPSPPRKAVVKKRAMAPKGGGKG